MSNYLNWIVRNSTELEMNMNAVERVDEYTKLETETTVSGKLSRFVRKPVFVVSDQLAVQLQKMA